MTKGKLIVFEGIYGAGKIISATVEHLRQALTGTGKEIYEIDSPDSGRALLMGAQEMNSSWRYGIFLPDFLFELASRARACAVIGEELDKGKIVLCNHFTLSSIVYAHLKGHDWFREDLNCLEARARELQSGRVLVPDCTFFLDVPLETALGNLGERIDGYFTPADVVMQQKLFKEELAKLPDNKKCIINADKKEEDVAREILAVITRLAG